MPPRHTRAKGHGLAQIDRDSGHASSIKISTGRSGYRVIDRSNSLSHFQIGGWIASLCAFGTASISSASALLSLRRQIYLDSARDAPRRDRAREYQRRSPAGTRHVIGVARDQARPVAVKPKESSIDRSIVRGPGGRKRADEFGIALRQNAARPFQTPSQLRGCCRAQSRPEPTS